MPRRGLKYYPRCFTREQSIGGWAPYLYNGKFVGGRKWHCRSKFKDFPKRPIQCDVFMHREHIEEWKKHGRKRWENKWAYGFKWRRTSNNSNFAGAWERMEY